MGGVCAEQVLGQSMLKIIISEVKMPELAEVEIARQNVARWWQDRTATEVHILDPKLLGGADAGELEEALRQRLVAMHRRGKYLIAELESGQHIIFHFRMTGKIVRSDVESGRFARLAWLVPESGWLLFKDQRRFGRVELLQPGELEGYAALVAMGPEPHGLRVEDLQARLRGKRTLKAALLDQKVIAGVGNIAISEVFWRIGLAPEIRVDQINDAQLEALVADLPVYFDEVIEASRADEIVYLEEGGDAENIFSVYGRKDEPCPRCETPIVREVIASRSTFYCPVCQVF